MSRSKSIVALLLTFAAGFVDIVGYLIVYRTFTAHMTGVTVHLGQRLIEKNWLGVAISASVLSAFLLGSVIGRTVIELGWRLRMRKVASISLAIEAGLLLTLIPLGHCLFEGRDAASSIVVICGLLGMLAAAMGLQTATLTRVGPLTVHTTFVTGMLNKLSQLIARWLFLAYDVRRRAHDHDSDLSLEKRKTARESRFIFGIWFLYLLGATCGAYLARFWHLEAFYFPVGLLLVAIGVDQLRPLSIEEEKEQIG